MMTNDATTINRSIFAVFLNFKVLLPRGSNKAADDQSSVVNGDSSSCPAIPSGSDFLGAMSKAFQDMGLVRYLTWNLINKTNMSSI